jgi:hypothetical protein
MGSIPARTGFYPDGFRDDELSLAVTVPSVKPLEKKRRKGSELSRFSDLDLFGGPFLHFILFSF